MKEKEPLQLMTYHTHDGLNSPRVNPNDLYQFQQYVQIKPTTLTPTQIKALNTTPITLVPGQGTGTLIIVESIDAKITYAGTAYTGANAAEFRYTDASGAKVTADMAAAFLNSSATAYDHVAGVVTELTPVAAAAIVVTVPTANPATGNSPITFVVKYRVVTFF